MAKRHATQPEMQAAATHADADAAAAADSGKRAKQAHAASPTSAAATPSSGAAPALASLLPHVQPTPVAGPAAGAAKIRAELAVALGAVLSGVTVKEVLKSKRTGVLALRHNQTVGDAMQALARERVLSAPVQLSDSVEDHEGGTYLCVVDVATLLHAMLAGAPSDAAPLSAHKKYRNEFFERKLVSINGGDVRLVHLVEAKSETLLECVAREFFEPQFDPALIATGKPAVRTRVHHRVNVFDSSGRIVYVLSQSDVVRYIHSQMSRLPSPLQTATVQTLGLGKAPVQVVTEDLNGWQALRELDARGVLGVGVVDSAGKLVAALSASDLRGLVPDEMALLDLPVRKFLQCEQAPVLNYRWRPVETITCRLDTPFRDVVAIFVTSRVHRVFVIDAEARPIRIITLTDVIGLVRASPAVGLIAGTPPVDASSSAQLI